MDQIDNEDRYAAKLINSLGNLFHLKDDKDNDIYLIPKEFLTENTVFSVENLSIFIRAFTHPSYDYNEDQNYEKLEVSGDPLANHFIEQTITRLYPNLSVSGTSNMLAFYKSNEIFGNYLIEQFGKNNLDSWLIRKNNEIYIKDEKDYADVFEAFINAVYVVCNNIIEELYQTRYGGYPCARNVFDYITRNLVYEEKHAQGASKTIVKELIPQNLLIVTPEKKGFQGILTVTITQEAYKEVQKIRNILTEDSHQLNKLTRQESFSYGRITSDDVLAESRSLVTRNVYDQILNWILPSTVNLSQYERAKTKYEIKQSQDPKSIQALEKANDKSLSLSFDKKKAAGGTYIWYLIGTTSDGVRKVLATARSDKASKGFSGIKKQLLYKFLDMNDN